MGWSKSADATVPEYPNCGVYIDNDQAENKVTTLYAVWVQIPVSARDIYLEYEDITKINNDEFMNEEADIRVNENEYNITLESSQIINLYEVYENAQKQGTKGSESDAKATVTYSTGDSVEITFKVYVAEYKLPDTSTTSTIRYIRKDTINTLRSTSDWIKSDKNSLLREVLNKDLSALKSYKVTKAKL